MTEPVPTRQASGWVAALTACAVIGAVAMAGAWFIVVQKRRHPGREPSPYVPGREWKPAGAVQSDDTGDFVDVSEPPTDELTAGTATSTPASK